MGTTQEGLTLGLLAALYVVGKSRCEPALPSVADNVVVTKNDDKTITWTGPRAEWNAALEIAGDVLDQTDTDVLEDQVFDPAQQIS